MTVKAMGVDLAKIAWKLGSSTWVSEEIAGALDGVRMLPPLDLKIGQTELLNNDEFNGDTSRCAGYAGGVGDIDITSNHLFRYKGLENMLYGAMGTITAVIDNSDDSYTRTFRPKKDLRDIFGTFAQAFSTYTSVYYQDKIRGFTITATAGQALNIAFLHRSGRYTNASTYNTTASMASVTSYTDDRGSNDSCLAPQPVLFRHATFRMDEFSDGSDLTSDDDIALSAFTVTFERAMTSDVTTETAPFNAEPLASGWKTTTLSVTIPQATEAQLKEYQDLCEDKVAQKGRFIFAGSTFAGGGANGLIIDMPCMKVSTKNQSVDGAGVIPTALEFDLSKCKSAPTGFSFADAFYMTLTNTRSDNPA